jgi:hypothetical protein
MLVQLELAIHLLIEANIVTVSMCTFVLSTSLILLLDSLAHFQ